MLVLGALWQDMFLCFKEVALALLSTEAEYMDMVAGYSDNWSAIELAKNSMYQGRSKHIENWTEEIHKLQTVPKPISD